MRGNDGFGIFLDQFRTRGKHPDACEVKSGPSDETGQDATRAGFIERIRGDDYVSELLRHNQIKRTAEWDWLEPE